LEERQPGRKPINSVAKALNGASYPASYRFLLGCLCYKKRSDFSHRVFASGLAFVLLSSMKIAAANRKVPDGNAIKSLLQKCRRFHVMVISPTLMEEDDDGP
jgi:hypothetical protein